MSNSYTLSVTDALGLVSSDIEASIRSCAALAIQNISRYVTWNGTLDVAVKVRPANELTWSPADGLLPSIVSAEWMNDEWSNNALYEAATGTDRAPQESDVGCTIYLARDGTIRNYGAPVWFDPAPTLDATPNIPSGAHDFISIITHEIFHGLGFAWWTTEWNALQQQVGGHWYFSGQQTIALLGESLPLGDSPDDHYASDALQNWSPNSNGLMSKRGWYEHNRWEIGRLDLAVLADLGYAIKTYSGLPLADLLDERPDVVGSGRNDTLFGDFRDNILTGLEGNDTLDGGGGTDTAVYGGNRAAYTIRGGGSTVDGPEGSDTLAGIERMQFLDKKLAFDLDLNSPGGSTVRIIGAAFDAPAIEAYPNYVGIGLGLFDTGTSMAEACTLVVGILNLGNEAFVTAVYTNVVKAAPSTQDHAAFVGMLAGSGGTLTQAELLELAANASVNEANINLVGLQASGVEFV